MLQGMAPLLEELDRVRRIVRGVRSAQIFSAPTRQDIHRLGTLFFSETYKVIAQIPNEEALASELESIFQELLAASRKTPSKSKCIGLLDRARKIIVRLEGAQIKHDGKVVEKTQNQADVLIVESLREICPAAAASYAQALRDLESTERLSYRGPATDFREALREVLDVLAPDKDVLASPGFKLESEAKQPTMKQKTRFVLRSRGLSMSQIASPEGAVEGVEAVIGGLVRSVYTRSSVSTHTATSRPEVLRIHAWVRLVLCELLELPTN